MPQLTVGNQTFFYPDPGTEAGWGEDATGWAEAVTLAITALFSPGDILPTTLVIANNATVATAVVGMSFNRSVVRASNVYYHVSRQVGSPGVTEIMESGIILITAELKGTASPVFTMTQVRDGNAGISFTIDDGGQVYYTSTNIVGTNYVGTICFSARTLTVG